MTRVSRDDPHQSRPDVRGGDEPAPPYWRPRVRGDCINGPRPCPYVGCRYHLWMEASRYGGLRVQHDGRLEGLRQMPYTCSLDAADGGAMSIQGVARALGIKSYLAQKLIKEALRRMRRRKRLPLAEF